MSPRFTPPWRKRPEQLLDEIGELTNENREHPDGRVERKLLNLRHRAGLGLTQAANGDPAYPTPAFDRLPADSGPAEAGPDDLDPEFVRAAILRDGCVLIRALVGPDEAKSLADEIERAYVARSAHAAGAEDADERYFAPFEPDRKFDLSSERAFSQDAAGLWVADSPHVMFDVLDVFERTGLTRMATGYLGQHPVMSVNKSVLRKVPPDIFGDSSEGDQKPSGWHQDGRFMGSVTALNVWMALCRCGDVAPGLEFVPRRLGEIVPTGTEGATFDWSVSRAIAEESAGDAPILRPIFEAGDVLLFDEYFLHTTAADSSMPNVRYAIETWLFAPEGFPAQYAPLAM
jgi:hypothetical protein